MSTRLLALDFAPAPLLTTDRLRLRGWGEGDLAPFAALNADPRVVEFLPQALSREESDALVGRIQAQFRSHGFGLWAVEVPDGRFAGFVGLAVQTFEAPFTPAVEVGWRLAAEHWRRGYASEAARAALDHAFGPAGLSDVVSMTVPANLRSRAVMERLGLHRDPADDFDHPRWAEGHRVRRHVLYRISAAEWRAGRGQPLGSVGDPGRG